MKSTQGPTEELKPHIPQMTEIMNGFFSNVHTSLLDDPLHRDRVHLHMKWEFLYV